MDCLVDQFQTGQKQGQEGYWQVLMARQRPQIRLAAPREIELDRRYRANRPIR